MLFTSGCSTTVRRWDCRTSSWVPSPRALRASGEGWLDRGQPEERLEERLRVRVEPSRPLTPRPGGVPTRTASHLRPEARRAAMRQRKKWPYSSASRPPPASKKRAFERLSSFFQRRSAVSCGRRTRAPSGSRASASAGRGPSAAPAASVCPSRPTRRRCGRVARPARGSAGPRRSTGRGERR